MSSAAPASSPRVATNAGAPSSLSAPTGNPSTETLVPQLRALTTTLAASLRAQGGTKARALLLTCSSAQTSLRSTQAQALLKLTTQFDAAELSLSEQLAQAHTQVDARAQADRARAEQASKEGHEAGLNTLNGTLAAAQAEVQSEAQAPLRLAETEGLRAADSLESQAQYAEQCTETVAARHAPTEHGEVAAAAARDLGTQTAANLRGQAPILQQDTLVLGQARAASNQNTLDSLNAQLAELPAQLNHALSGLGGSACAQLDHLAATSHAKLDTLGDQLRTSLQQAREAAKQTLQARADAACQQLDAQGQSDALGAESLAEAQAAQVEAIGPTLCARLEEVDSPDQVFEQLESALCGVEAQALEEQDQAQQKAEQDLEGQTESINLDIDPSAELSGLNAQAFSQITTITESQTQGGDLVVTGTTETARDSTAALVAEAQTLSSSALHALRADNDGFQAELTSGLNARLAEAALATQGLPARAEEAARRAAEQAQQPWWQDALDGIWAGLETLIRGLTVLVTVTIIVLLGALALPGAVLTTELVLLCVAVAACMLMVQTFISSALERWSAGQGALASLYLAGLDALGLTALYEAITGDDTRSERRLSAADRWNRGTQGVVALLQLLSMVRGGKTSHSKAPRSDGAPEGPTAAKTPPADGSKGKAPPTEKPSQETAAPTTDTSRATAEKPQAPAPEEKVSPTTQESPSPKVTAKNHTVEYNSPNNPFKGKTFEQIDNEFTERGFIKKGADPLHQRGSYIDPETNTRYFLDKGGQYADGFEPPHVDVWPPSGQKLKMMLNGDIWTPNAR